AAGIEPTAPQRFGLSRRHKTHTINRRQMRGDWLPRIAAVFRNPQTAGGRADCQLLAIAVDIHAVAIDQIVGRLVRQTAMQRLEGLPAVACSVDDETTI